MSLSRCFSALLLPLLLAGSPAAFADPLYTITFLPGDFSASAIGRDGQVVGTSRGGAALWSTSSTTYFAALLPGSEGLAINGAGAIAGRSGNGGFVYQAGSVELFALPAGSATWATGINDAGQVSGVARQGFGEHVGFRYSGGSFTEMGNFGGVLSIANAINARGGFAALPSDDWSDLERHAAVLRGGALRDLGTLGGRISEASDINDLGFVVGWSELAGGVQERPFLFSPEGTCLTDLGSLGGSAGRANGINNAGTVVGLSDIGGAGDIGGFNYHAFVYGPKGMADLNTLVASPSGWTLVSALDVNDAGQILAQACNDSLAECRAVRLDLISAVPEPGTWAMLAGGLVLLLWRARRRTLWIAAAPLLAAPLASAQALPDYTPVFLPAGFEASAINARGHVAGYTAGAAALWDGSTLTEYTAAAPGSFALALDGRSQMVGGWQGDAYLFSPNGVRSLGRKGLWSSSFAVALNDLGAVAGGSYWGVGERSRGFVLANGVLRMIPSFGGDWSGASAINRSGQVVGSAAMPDDNLGEPSYRAFVYKDKSMRQLGTLGGKNSEAFDINDAGQVVGFASTADVDEFGNQAIRAYLYTGGRMRDLGTLGGVYSGARGINNGGLVVGESNLDSPEGFELRAVIWAGGRITDLNTRAAMPDGWLLVSARDINDAGQILARACRFEDCLHLRLDPAPAR